MSAKTAFIVTALLAALLLVVLAKAARATPQGWDGWIAASILYPSAGVLFAGWVALLFLIWKES